MKTINELLPELTSQQRCDLGTRLSSSGISKGEYKREDGNWVRTYPHSEYLKITMEAIKLFKSFDPEKDTNELKNKE